MRKRKCCASSFYIYKYDRSSLISLTPRVGDAVGVEHDEHNLSIAVLSVRHLSNYPVELIPRLACSSR